MLKINWQAHKQYRAIVSIPARIVVRGIVWVAVYALAHWLLRRHKREGGE